MRAAVVPVLFLGLVMPAHAQLALSSAPGGITFASSGNNYHSSFGKVNALGIGPAQSGVTVIPLNNGALYYSLYQLTVGGAQSGEQEFVTAYVSANFANPAALILQNCPVSSACTSSGGYSAESLNSGAQTTVIASPGLDNQTVTAGLAIFVPDNNGAGAFSGNNFATIAFSLYSSSNSNSLVQTIFLSLDTPQETLQPAVQLNLTSDPSGLTIGPAADYAMNFGNVNGLGIGPAFGLSTATVPGGTLYSTPYRILPRFSDCSSTTATVRAYVSTDFIHPAVLELRDSSASGGPFTAISKNSAPASQTLITSSAADGSTLARYVGLFVSTLNGAGAFTGVDNANVTYTVTVP